MKIFLSILDWGAYAGMTIQAQKQLGALNAFVAAAVVFNSIACIIYSESAILLYVTLATTIFCAFILVMNGLFQYRLSRLLLLHYMFIISVIVSSLMGREAYYQLVLLMAAILAMLLFDCTEKFWKVYSLSVSFACYWLLEATDYPSAYRVVLPDHLQKLTPILIISFCFVALTSALYAFTRFDESVAMEHPIEEEEN